MGLQCGGIAAVDGEDVVEGSVGVSPLVVEALHVGAHGGILIGYSLDVGLRLLRVGQDIQECRI